MASCCNRYKVIREDAFSYIIDIVRNIHIVTQPQFWSEVVKVLVGSVEEGGKVGSSNADMCVHPNPAYSSPWKPPGGLSGGLLATPCLARQICGGGDEAVAQHF